MDYEVLKTVVSEMSDGELKKLAQLATELRVDRAMAPATMPAPGWSADEDRLWRRAMRSTNDLAAFLYGMITNGKAE